MLAVIVGYAMYGLLGAMGFRRWRRRHPVPGPNMQADPARWRAYWLPLLVVFEGWALGAIGFVWLLVQRPPRLHDQWFEVGLLLGIVLYLVICVGMDMALVIGTATALRRRRA